MSVIVSPLGKQRVNISLKQISMGKLGMIDRKLSEFFYVTCINFNETWHLGDTISFPAH